MRGAAGGGSPLQYEAAAVAIPENPVLVGGAVLGLLVLVGGGWLVMRRFQSSSGARLQRVLGQHDELTVLLHPNPDPDAMASGLAAATLARAKGTDVTIQFPGQIRRQENRAFENVLELDCDRIETAGDIATDAVVLVDHNEPRGFPGAERIDPVAVVDHHPGGGTGDSFTDVRPDHGACATIFSEYFEELGWEPTNSTNGSEGITPSVATGLLYGIQSDTKHLTSGCARADFMAAAFLYDGIDGEMLDRIANPEIDAEVLEIKARAIMDREVRNAFAISDVGTIGNVDAIPQAAEELHRLEGVTAVIVLGDREGTLHLSGRSRDDRLHMGTALSAAVEDIPMAEAGGHARMGGGQLSLDHMEGIGPSEGVTREQLKERLFEAMNGELQ